MRTPNNIPATVVAEMMNRLRRVEAAMFNLEDKEIETAQKFDNIATATENPKISSQAEAQKNLNEVMAATWRASAIVLQNELDAIEHHLADLGLDIPVDNGLTVGAEVRELFGERRDQGDVRIPLDEV